MSTASEAAESLFGGNVVRRFEPGFTGRRDYAYSPYLYFAYNLRAEENLDVRAVSGLQSFSVYLFSAAPGAAIVLIGTSEALGMGDVLQSESTDAVLEAQGGAVDLLIAGVTEAAPLPAGLSITRAADIKKVSKPWGFELWLTGEHPAYAFKHIVIRKGFRTSLQYHQLKRETNVLMAGTARCSYKLEAAMPNDDVTESAVGAFTMEPISALDVFPNTLHRIESVSDITLCEVSTPQLDDVVRVIDDSGRASGRIASEHRTAG